MDPPLSLAGPYQLISGVGLLMSECGMLLLYKRVHHTDRVSLAGTSIHPRPKEENSDNSPVNGKYTNGSLASPPQAMCGIKLSAASCRLFESNSLSGGV